MCTLFRSTPSNMCFARHDAVDAGLVARLAERVVVAIEARDRLEVARRHVHRQRERRAARALGALDHAERDVPVRRRIELEPDRRAARLAHVLDRVVRDGREHLERVLRLRRARDGDLALGMERLLRADGAEQDRRRVPLAEELDRHVDLRDVDEPLRPELDLLEARSVRRDRAEVVGALRHVRVVVCADGVAHHGLEVPDVQRLVRALDEVGPLERAAEDGVVLPASGRSWAASSRSGSVAPSAYASGLWARNCKNRRRARDVSVPMTLSPGVRPWKHSTFAQRPRPAELGRAARGLRAALAPCCDGFEKGGGPGVGRVVPLDFISGRVARAPLGTE